MRPISPAISAHDPTGPVADQVRRTVFQFTDTVIARMIPIGQMMRQSLNCA